MKTDEILPKLDGIVFPGGADVDPARYGERPHLKLGSVQPQGSMNWSCIWPGEVLDMGLPVVGICRGCQVVNVAAGGTLVQDIPSSGWRSDENISSRLPRWHGTHESHH